MSDPEQNRWFRRRWVETPPPVVASQATGAVPDHDDLALCGLALLQAWRRERGQPGEVLG